jgi:hypothetical protein
VLSPDDSRASDGAPGGARPLRLRGQRGGSRSPPGRSSSPQRERNRTAPRALGAISDLPEPLGGAGGASGAGGAGEWEYAGGVEMLAGELRAGGAGTQAQAVARALAEAERNRQAWQQMGQSGALLEALVPLALARDGALRLQALRLLQALCYAPAPCERQAESGTTWGRAPRAQSAAARVLRAPGMLQALLGAVAGQGPGAVSAQIRAEGARVLYALLRSEVQVQAASRPAARAPARGSGGRRAEGVARASLEVIKVTLIWAGGRGGAGAGGAGGGGADGRGRGVARGALAQHGRRRAHGEPRAAP